jgi:flagellar hook-associated protein 2
VLRSASTGASNAFRVSVTDTDGNNTDAAGLSALAFDPSAGILTMAQALAAANAAASLNSLPIASESNTLSNVLDGMTLTLGKVTTAPVQVTATQDDESIRKSVDAFVKAYNELNTLLAEQTKYDAASKKAGTLQGDSAEVGIDVQRDGSISLNETKLKNGMANLAEMQKLFANSDLVTPANNGIATQIRTIADQLLSIDGSISSRTEGLQKRIDLNEDRQERLEERLALTEKRLLAQYTALDARMGQLNSLSSYITQQIAAFNANSGSD